ncbi:replication initiation protein [Glaesserella parasuis]|uniref:replication initiation protein n=1 Tax=Glaesserella parasuis TaxID=738 RepID=UPI002436F951|nr:replication initiation protein [Glaesserella parasuis]MDG6304308.1 replication initiation protein [Glaesserella parasuis]MDG6824334.1 replication initiation protein [Glaesserella parasuis]MDG6833338.1 replication initiation protein [Glaesserella parasuis]MDO9959437.1 replication initiation protein [Glaesserella parasuis]MDP0052875.1 replication initiation protein [Glaesserella parasuis]
MSDLMIRKAHPIVEAGYKLTIAEQRIILLSLAKLDNRNVENSNVTLYVKDYAQAFNLSETSAYNELNKASKRLYDRSIILKGEDETTEFRWIESRTRYYKGEGRISFQFSRRVMPYLFELDKRLGFTQYTLLSVSGFKSAYSIRLYELAVKLLGMQNQQVEIDELRRILQLDNQYSEFRFLKRDVINLACNEINEKSDILLNIEPVKRGRKIVALEFQIAKKAKQKKPEPTTSGTRKIHGVFDEIKRPQVAKGSEAEGKWATQNLNLAISQLRELGVLKKGVLVTEQFEKIPTEWLKVLAKYYAITDRYSAREINEILSKL